MRYRRVKARMFTQRKVVALSCAGLLDFCQLLHPKGNTAERRSPKFQLEGVPHVMRSYAGYGMVGYLVSRAGAIKIVNR